MSCRWGPPKMGKLTSGLVVVLWLSGAAPLDWSPPRWPRPPRFRIHSGRGVRLEHIAELRRVLQQSWQRFVALGFRAPLSDNTPAPIVIATGVGFLPFSQRTDFGTSPPTIHLPHPEAADLRSRPAIPAHELFHLFQWGYHYPIPAASQCGWLYEGMAYWAAFEATDPERLASRFSYDLGTPLFHQREGAALFWRYLHRSPATRRLAVATLAALHERRPQTALEIQTIVGDVFRAETGRNLGALVAEFEQAYAGDQTRRVDVASH